MRVQFLRGTALGGVGNDASPGDVLDLPAAQAAGLIAAGRAAALPDEPQDLVRSLSAPNEPAAAQRRGRARKTQEAS